MMGCNFAPSGWAFCDGRLLPLSQNTALFSLLGTTYGGNGSQNFALPDLQGRMPMHWGQSVGLSERTLGETGGAEQVTLVESQIPVHQHTLNVAGPADAALADPSGAVLGQPTHRPYAPVGTTPAVTSTQMLATAGGSQPHNNLPPYLVLNFVIAMQGIFPPRT